MRDSEPSPYSKEVVLADEDTPRDQSWKEKDFRNPETVRAAFIEMSSYAEEATKASRINRRNLAAQAEQHGLMMAMLARIDHRTELTDARTAAMAFETARTAELVDFLRTSARESEESRAGFEAQHKVYETQRAALEKAITDLKARNEVSDKSIANELMKLQRELAKQKREFDEARDISDDAKQRPSYVEAQTAPNALLPLATEIVRSALQSNADLKREEREEKREEAKVARERWSNREKALLGVLVTLILTAAAAFSERLLGHPTHQLEPTVPFERHEGK